MEAERGARPVHAGEQVQGGDRLLRTDRQEALRQRESWATCKGVVRSAFCLRSSSVGWFEDWTDFCVLKTETVVDGVCLHCRS